MIKNGNMSNINIQFSKMITNTMGNLMVKIPVPNNLYKWSSFYFTIHHNR